MTKHPEGTGSVELVQVDGTIRFMRTERDDPPADQCRCCDGAHIFCRYIEVPPAPSYGAVDHPSVRDWLSEALGRGPLENRRVRITMTLLPESEDSDADH